MLSIKTLDNYGNGKDKSLISQILDLLRSIRKINIQYVDQAGPNIINFETSSQDSLQSIGQLSSALAANGNVAESDALENAIAKCLERREFGGLGLSQSGDIPKGCLEEVLFLVDAWLEAINSQERARKTLLPVAVKSQETKPMTLAEKIFAHHTIGGCPAEGLKVGDMVRVSVDWVISSELSWKSIRRNLEEVSADKIWRNDRFWMAGDHMADPRTYERADVKPLIEFAEKAKRHHKMTEYQGMNYTIMHTEFVRERAQPGMITIGSDSHTCSAGAMGGLAIGLGASDVAMSLALGELWFKVPESILINFVGKPTFGITGKDVILYILKQLKRNTVAANRIVELSGPGAQWLSCDARFAICNMCTEFGAITGVFVPDAITQDYISKRKVKAHRSSTLYFKPDDNANYAEVFEIDLSNVESTIAVYPSPDNVVPVSEKIDQHLDGVFIGACTTTEEELILAALILQIGLKKGLKIEPGKRRVTPGSQPIVEKLRNAGFLDVYKTAGFEIGVPGCSYCIGMAADQASPGEVWLSSQNRNFKNRMGPGSFGSITSAATVAASSFQMKITDPRPFLKEVDVELFKKLTKYQDIPENSRVLYVEPHVGPDGNVQNKQDNSNTKNASTNDDISGETPTLTIIKSKIITLGDFVDTDALCPANWMGKIYTEKEFGDHCMEYTYPEFRELTRNGHEVVIGGKAFGCGSSRENAVRALKGCGVKAVIARSFAFIYSRNQPSLGLLGITLNDDAFYSAATDGETIEIDMPNRRIIVGEDKTFDFEMPEMEWKLTMNHGISEAYKKFGPSIWEELTRSDNSKSSDVVQTMEKPTDSNIQW